MRPRLRFLIPATSARSTRHDLGLRCATSARDSRCGAAAAAAPAAPTSRRARFDGREEPAGPEEYSSSSASKQVVKREDDECALRVECADHERVRERRSFTQLAKMKFAIMYVGCCVPFVCSSAVVLKYRSKHQTRARSKPGTATTEKATDAVRALRQTTWWKPRLLVVDGL
jgi:hypothetical protein